MRLFGPRHKKTIPDRHYEDKSSNVEIEEIESASEDDDDIVHISKWRKVEKQPVIEPLWIDAHAPTSVGDVAVHNGKIKQVRCWLEENANSRSLLVLTGPAGSGKTATVRALANEMKMDIIEWENGHDNSMGQFAQFIADSARIQSGLFSNLLNVESESGPSRGGAKLVLIEDLPNMSGSSVAADLRRQFQQILLGYLEQPGNAVCVVLIFSDCETRDDQDIDSKYSNSADRYNVESVLSNRVLNHRLTRQIKFNRVAKTILNKVLVRIATERHLLPTRFKPTRGKKKSLIKPKWQLVIDQLALGEDIRSAINGLEFFAKSSSTPNIESISILLNGMRQNWLNLFHAVGKTVFNRPFKNDTEQLRNTINPIELMSSISSSLYILSIQENYLVTNPCIMDASNAINYLSDCDVLMSHDGNQLREEASEVAIRGVLASIQHCQTNHAMPTSGGNKPRSLTFTPFWKCQSQRRENLSNRPNIANYNNNNDDDDDYNSTIRCNNDTFFCIDDFYTRIIYNKLNRRLGNGLTGSNLDDDKSEQQQQQQDTTTMTTITSSVKSENKSKLYLSEDDIEESDQG